MRAAAFAAQVSRETIYQWMQEDEAFGRELRESRSAARELARIKMIDLVPAALELVADAVQCDGLGASIAIARAMKLLDRLETAEGELGSGRISGAKEQAAFARISSPARRPCYEIPTPVACAITAPTGRPLRNRCAQRRLNIRQIPCRAKELGDAQRATTKKVSDYVA